jgi:hypothetical protein
MSKAHRATDNQILFFCPGCQHAHCISYAPGRWTFNGDFERPTFNPSVLVDGHYTGDDLVHQHIRCHSFVKDGNIQFLSDCDHTLAGKTVPLPDMDDEKAQA